MASHVHVPLQLHFHVPLQLHCSIFRCSCTAPCSSVIALLRYQKAKIIRLYHGFFLQMYTRESEMTIEN